MSTSASNPEVDSWNGELGYPDTEIDDTEYTVTWYRWVIVFLFSLFNVNCAIQIIGYNALAAQLILAFDVNIFAVTMLIVLPQLVFIPMSFVTASIFNNLRVHHVVYICCTV